MQLQNDSATMRRAGYGLAAISYDSQPVLADFSKRKGITFPLLSDHNSAVIRSSGLADRAYQRGAQLDVETERAYTNSLGYVPVYGLSYPAALVIDPDRRVRWVTVSESAELRLSGTAILENSVGAITDVSRTPVPGRFVQVAATASNDAAGLGQRVRISVELKIPPGTHVYSAQAEPNYKGVSWQMNETGCFDVGAFAFPAPEVKLLKATNERLPIYEGVLRLSREVTVKPEIRASNPAVFAAFRGRCVDGQGRLHVSGTLKYQACDEKQCFPPQTVTPQWTFRFIAPDTQRSPGELRRELEPQ